jgi:hypothetical protein
VSARTSVAMGGRDPYRGAFGFPVYRKAYDGVRGRGDVTWEYLLMLLGYDGVKADTLVKRFVAKAVGTELSSERVADVVKTAAIALKMSAKDFDHSIWRAMSGPRRS